MKLNRNFGELLKSGEVRAIIQPYGSAAAARAMASAPVRSGAYRRSIHTAEATTDRAVVRVVANVPYATKVEAATGNLVRALP